MAVLEHKGNGVHQLVFVDVLYIDAADGNAAALRVKETGDQCRQRGFASAGRPDKCHRLTRTDGERNILQGIFCAVVAEGDMIQRHRTVLGMLRHFRLRKRRAFQYAVNAGDGILHDHAVLAHEHQLGHCQRDDRRDDDVKEQIQQHTAIRSAVGEQEASCDQEHKHAVDCQRIESHRPAQLFRIGNDPALVIVDRSLELFEREYRLSEGLDYGNAPHIFYRFVGHIRQRVLILGHFVLQFLTGHAHHHRKGKRHRYKTQKPQPPIKDQQQRQKSRNSRHRLSLVRKLVGKVGFRRSGSF